MGLGVYGFRGLGLKVQGLGFRAVEFWGSGCCRAVEFRGLGFFGFSFGFRIESRFRV